MAYDVLSNYDENLTENKFFQILQEEYKNLFLTAVAENCLICIPRTETFSRYHLSTEDFLAHILVRTDELPETHFSNLCGERVKISNRVITVQHEVGRHSTAHVLFKETFYTDDSLKFEVLCVEQPLSEGILGFESNNTVKVIKSLKDCLDLIWVESGTHETIESIDKEVIEFLKNYDNVDISNVQDIKDAVSSLYVKCIQILLKNSKIKKKYKVCKQLFSNLKIAVETYLQNSIYEKIFKSIATCTATEDAKLNKVIRNLSDLHFQDLNISSKFYNNIPKARLELSKLGGYTTALGKIGCIKRTVETLSESLKDKIPISADDVLQVLSFLIIKTHLPNWNAQLMFLKLFYFSNLSYFDESSYLITSLEASITYIQGVFIKSQEIINFKENIEGCNSNFLKETKEVESLNDKNISQLFQEIAYGNLDNVKRIIERDKENIEDFSSLKLCHPLCACDKCSSVINKNICKTSPTVKSCDDQGLTALHIASMYNVPKIVEYLVAMGGDCNVSDCDGRTPVHYAALKGHQNALLLLLHNDANINVLDNSLNTPLHLCSNNGHENCVKALIYFSEYSGIKLHINSQNLKGDTALHNAAKWGYQSIIRILLEYGSDPTILNKIKFSPIDYAHNSEVSKLLKQHCRNSGNCVSVKPSNPTFDLDDDDNIINKQNNSIHKNDHPNTIETMKKVEKVLCAIKNGDTNLVCFYMGFDVSEFNSDKNNYIKVPKNGIVIENKCHPLCSCENCESLDVESSCKLSETKTGKSKSLSVNICDSEGFTPLHVASKYGKLDLVQGFISKGALLNAQTLSQLWTPLILACMSQKLEVAKELLKAGCNVDMQDCQLNTALHVACETGNSKLVELLLKYEPDVNLRNIYSKTALQVAKDKLSLGIIQLLQGGPPLDINNL